MKSELRKVTANGPGGWESFLFIASTNYDQRPEMHFAYIKANVQPQTLTLHFVISLYLMAPHVFNC